MHTKTPSVPASYLICMQEHKTLLLRRYNTGYEDGNYSLVAGHVEPGETFSACIIREAKEEAGIVIDPNDIQVCHVMHRNSKTKENNERIDVFFVAKKWQGEITNREQDKCDDLSRFDVNNLPKNTIPYIRHVFQCIANNEFYSEFDW